MKIHTVKKAETLRDIARLCPLGLQALLRANGLDPLSRPVPGQSLIIPNNSCAAAGGIETAAFVPLSAGAASLREPLPFFTYLCPYALSFSPEGTLCGPEPKDLAGLAREEGCAPLLCLANTDGGGGFSAELAHGLFSSEESRELLLRQLLARLKSERCYGLQLCFNYLFPFDRDNYSAFVSQLSQRLHEAGFLLSVELAPMDSAALCAGHDYKALGRAADRLHLMCCRWGHSFSPPRPLSPMAQLRAALDYAAEKIAPEKILMSFSGCGFDWKLPWQQGMQARQISNAAAAELAMATGAGIEYDEAAAAPRFDYTDPQGLQHRVFFEDARSIAAKLQLAGEYGLAGISLCPAQRPFSPALSLLEDMYAVEKLL